VTRIVIVGGPMSGKSTLARQLRAEGLPTFCGDPRSTVRAPEPDVTYLPEGLDWSAGSQFIVDEWFTMPGPWVCEGHVMARALRKHLERGVVSVPADRILVLRGTHPHATQAQVAMTKAVRTVWREVAPQLVDVTEFPEVRFDDVGRSPLDLVRDLVGQIH
jgi:hypothetical protein